MKTKDIIKIKAVGDICPGDKTIMGIGVLGKSKMFGPDFPLKKIKKHLSDADIVIGNIEGLLSKQTIEYKNNLMTFCGIPEFADSLVEAGFNVLNIANNHTFEHGEHLFQETVRILKNANINICGLRSKSSMYYSEPVIISKKNKMIGILGYNWIGKDKFINADQFISQSHDSVVNYTWDRTKNDQNKQYNAKEFNKNVINDIKTLKNNVDYVILMTHWGYEFVHIPPLGVTNEAKSFIDAGADIIIGAHPHVIQGYEIYKEKKIFYSLGNFIFDFKDSRSKYSIILNAELNGDRNHSFTPVYINKYFQPQLANKYQENKINSILKKSNRIINDKDSKQELCDNKVYKTYEKIYLINKFINILSHFLALKEDINVSIIILNKIKSFFKIVSLRIKGDNIRW